MKISVFCVFILVSLMSFAQESAEIGLRANAGYYTGEINKWPFQSIQPGGGVFYRHSFNKRYALRGNLDYGYLSGSDANQSSQYKQERAWSFKTQYLSISALGEFNFMPYIPGDLKLYPYTPYVVVGVGFVTFFSSDNSRPVHVPFGAGFKYNLSNKFLVSLEFLTSKTFRDDIEGISETTKNIPQKIQEHTNDWFGTLSISLSYRLDYRRKCRAFD